MKRAVIWGCGSAVMSLQWLSWFSSDSFCSTWLSQASIQQPIMGLSEAMQNICFLVLVFIMVRLSKTTRSLFEAPWLLTGGTILLLLGNLVNMSISFELASPWLSIVGFLCVRTGLSILLFGWAEYYCMVGPKVTGVILSVGYIIAALLFTMLNQLSQISMLATAALQLLFIPLSQIFMQQGWKRFERRRFDRAEESSFRLKPLLPYMMAIFALGTTTGSLFALADLWSGSMSPLVWTAATVVASIVILAVVWRRSNMNFISCFRGASIPLLGGLLLIPLFWQSSFAVVCFIIYAVYSSANIFNQMAYVSLSQTRTTSVLPLVVCSIAAESMGLYVGNAVCGFATAMMPASFETIYLIALVLCILLFATFRNKSLSKLFGLDARVGSEADVENCCGALALQSGLTPREAEILVDLAKGRSAQEIADDLCISVTTVRTHTRNIYKKTDIHSQTELVRKIVYAQNQ